LLVTKFVESGKLPHLLFYGPPGTGKTTTILALARKMFGSGAALASNVLEVRPPPIVNATLEWKYDIL